MRYIRCTLCIKPLDHICVLRVGIVCCLESIHVFLAHSSRELDHTVNDRDLCTVFHYPYIVRRRTSFCFSFNGPGDVGSGFCAVCVEHLLKFCHESSHSCRTVGIRIICIIYSLRIVCGIIGCPGINDIIFVVGSVCVALIECESCTW